MNKIQEFNELHTAKELLFLGNAWDLLSALMLEKAGFKAIGTTSWGISNTFGQKDGENISFEQNLGVVKSIAEHVKVPVSADLEAGYGEDAPTIVDNVLRVADVGAAGINIEDSFKRKKGLKEIPVHADLLSKLRTALDQRGYQGFYINARIDTYFRLEDPFAETIDRAKAYVDSGVSGVFVPGVTNHKEIQEIAASVKAPLNILSLPGVTNCNELQALGVKRLSFGNWLSDKVIAYIEMNAARLMELKDTSFLHED